MIPGYDEERYINIINLLKQLPKVTAPPDFESDLMMRINSGNFKEKYKVHWWDKLFLPSRLIPAAAFALSIVAVFYFLNFNTGERENPFLAKPKMKLLLKLLVNKNRSCRLNIQKLRLMVRLK